MNLSPIFQIIQANIIFIVLLAVYHFLLKNDTRFKFNRFYLLSILVFSACIPFVQIPFYGESTVLTFPALSDMAEMSTAENSNGSLYFSLGHQVAALYGCISMLLIIRSTFNLSRLINRIKRIKNSAHFDEVKGIYVTEDKIAPFTFLSWSFIPKSIVEKENSDLIIAHEKLHNKELHTLDIIAAELISCLLFLNPLNKLFKKYITENHEYRADKVALENDTHSKYESLLIEHTLYPIPIPMISYFAKPLILNRLIMMKKRKTTIAYQTFAVFSTLLVLALFSCDVQENEEIVIKEEENNKTLSYDPSHVFTVVENQAEPVDGIDDFYNNISANLSYPQQALRLGIEGVVYVQFIIEKDGSLSNLTAVKGIGAGCDQAAIDALAASGNWIPGKQAGKIVRSQRVIPIRFKLQ